MDDLGHPVFDADNHYYEATDALTRHLDPALGPRCVQWATIDGRQYHVLGGRVSRAVTNATFDPVSKPGCLYDYFRGNAEGADPLSPAPGPRADPARVPGPRRPAGHARRPGPGRLLAVPDARHDLRGAAAPRPRGRVPDVPGLQPVARRGLGLRPRRPDLRRPLPHARRPGLGRRGAGVGAGRGRPPAGDAPPRPPPPRWAAAPRSTRCSTRSGPGSTRRASPWSSTPATAACRPTATRSTASPPRSPAATPPRSRTSPSRRPSTTGCCRWCCPTTSASSPTCGVASVENGAEFLPDLFRKLRSVDRKMPGWFDGDPVDRFRRHVWINPFWEDDLTWWWSGWAPTGCCSAPTGPTSRRCPSRSTTWPRPRRSTPADRRKVLYDNVTELTAPRPR